MTPLPNTDSTFWQGLNYHLYFAYGSDTCVQRSATIHYSVEEPSCPVCNSPHDGRRRFWIKACSLATERARGLAPAARRLFLELLQYGLAPRESAAPAALPYMVRAAPPATRPMLMRRTLRPRIKSRLRREWRPRGRRGVA